MSRPEDIRKDVSRNYARAVEQTKAPTSSCCAGPAPESILATLAGYSREALASLPADAVASSFGCGNPVALGEIRAGDTVLDCEHNKLANCDKTLSGPKAAAAGGGGGGGGCKCGGQCGGK